MEDVMKQFSDVKMKFRDLEEKNFRLTEEVAMLNRQLRKNNLIIYNVPIAENENVVGTVKEVCTGCEIIIMIRILIIASE